MPMKPASGLPGSELTYLLQEHDQAWAGDMIEVLTHASHPDNVNCAEGDAPPPLHG